MENIFNEIESERQEQLSKFGISNHSPVEWISILSEELGEAAKEAVEYHFFNYKGLYKIDPIVSIGNMRKELIQLAAVSIAAIHSLDRNELKELNEHKHR